MQKCSLESVIKLAESDTSSHLRFLRKTILHSLQFIVIIILIDVITVATADVHGRSAEYIRDLLKITPNPILLIALVISAAIHLYLLRRIRTGCSTLKLIRRDTSNVETKRCRKSITDINYDIIKAINISLKIWPFVAILFIIYFVGCFSMLFDLIPGIEPDISLDTSTALNLMTVIVSAYFFTTQTILWWTHRKKMMKLEMMEKQISRELHL